MIARPYRPGDDEFVDRILAGYIYEECHHGPLRRFVGRLFPQTHRHPVIAFEPEPGGPFSIVWNSQGIFRIGGEE